MTSVLLLLCGLMMLRSAWKGIDGYGAFLRGAKEGMNSAVSLLPALCAMLLMVNLLQASGLSACLTDLLSPLLSRLGISEKAAGMVLLRPLTGSGSLAMLEQVFRECGVDSREGMLASVVMGSSETIFYTMTVYLGATDLRRLPWVLPVSMISYAVSVCVAALVV